MLKDKNTKVIIIVTSIIVVLIIIGTILLIAKFANDRQNNIVTVSPEVTVAPEPTPFTTTNSDGQIVVGNNTPRPTVSFMGSALPTPTPMKIEWIYYIKYAKGSNGANNIYKMRSDGSEAMQVGDATGYVIGTSGDWVYINDGYLYKIHPDGSGKQKIGSDSVNAAFLNGDYIYYSDSSPLVLSKNIYKIKTDGSGRQLLYNDGATQIGVYGDKVYYYSFNSSAICRIDISGDNRVVLADNTARPSGFFLDAGKILYSDDHGNAVVIKENGVDTIMVPTKFDRLLAFGGDRIYGTADKKLISVDINGNDIREIEQADKPISEATLWGDYIYYIESTDAKSPAAPGYVSVIKSDGTGFAKIGNDLVTGFTISYY